MYLSHRPQMKMAMNGAITEKSAISESFSASVFTAASFTKNIRTEAIAPRAVLSTSGAVPVLPVTVDSVLADGAGGVTGVFGIAEIPLVVVTYRVALPIADYNYVASRWGRCSSQK